MKLKYREISAENEPQKNKDEKAEGFFDKVIGKAKEFGAKTKDVFEESKIGDKMKIAGDAILSGTKTAGLFVYDKAKIAGHAVSEKGKKIGSNPTVQSIGEKATEGFSKAANAISSVNT